MQFTPKNRDDWRDWLRRNHASAKREDTRQRRIEEAIDLLAHGKRLGMR